MGKIPVWLLALALITVGAAGTIGIGYQKANDEGISGEINIITSQAIGVNSISFGEWPEWDDSAIGVIAEDGLSYVIGLQLNNGDVYGDPETGEEIKICLYNYAKTDMVVMLTTEFGITQPDPADVPCDDIHIWYTDLLETQEYEDNTIGQIDPWTYLIKIPAAQGDNSVPGKVCFYMWIDVGNMLEPGFYQFHTYIEPTNWGYLSTENMEADHTIW